MERRGKMRGLVAVFTVACLLFCACGGSADNKGNNGDPPDDGKKPPVTDTTWRDMTDFERTISALVATDDYERSIAVCGGENGEKYVGVFFFCWNGEMSYANRYDVSEITGYATERDDPKMDAFFGDKDTADGRAHHWGKPIWDYYAQDDPWVLRKQVEMLTMAGVDFFYLDVTNARRHRRDPRDPLSAVMDTYDRTTRALMDVLLEYQKAGWDVPKLLFYTNDNGVANPDSNKDEVPEYEDIEVVRHLYRTHYTDHDDYTAADYKSLWFAPNGKPMLVMREKSQDVLSVADPEEDAEGVAIYEFFDWKNTVWPNDPDERKDIEAPLDPDSFSWMETYYPRSTDRYLRNRGGYVNISVAQHMNTVRFSDMTKNFGRGYDYEAGKNVTANARKGTNYQYLWDRVLESKDKVTMVGITGWNEWIGGKFLDKAGNVYMVDCFNEEYSRDIEPCYNGYGDNFYLQTAQNIRSFKYDAAPAATFASASPDVTVFADTDWTSGTVYRDFTGECIARNHRGWVPLTSSPMYEILTDTSNRNDIDTVTVTHDEQNIYFRITVFGKDLSTPQAGDTSWMNVLIKTQDSGEGSLFGYNYVINRNVAGGKGEIARRTSSGGYEKVGEATVAYSGKVLQIAVPRDVLSLTGSGAPRFDFKVADHITEPENVLSYYNSGDSAPIGRLGYAYGF